MAAQITKTGRLLFPSPFRLIYSEEGKSHLYLNEALLRQLIDTIGNKQIRISSIIGPYRSGKSFIMNMLCGHEGPGGFDLGHEVASKTKGIWVWGFENQDDTVTLAIDSEGLGDPTNVAVQEADIKRMLLLILISSHVTINIRSSLDFNTLDQLSFVADLSKWIEGDFHAQFPSLTFLLRDFSLGLDDHNKDPDHYLNHVLKEDPKTTEDFPRYNLIRQSIRESFHPLTCVTFVSPVLRPEDELKQLDTIEASKYLRTEFTDQAQRYIASLNAYSRVKTVNDQPLTGLSLEVLLQVYVTALNKPSPRLSIDSAFEAIIAIQIQQTTAEVIAFYQANMKWRLSSKLPCELDELYSMHENCLTDAVKYYQSRIGGNQGKLYKDGEMNLHASIIRHDGNQNVIGGAFLSYLTENIEASRLQCQSIWREISEKFSSQIANGTFKSIEEFNAAQTRFLQDFKKRAIGPARDAISEESSGARTQQQVQFAQQLEITKLEQEQKRLYSELQEKMQSGSELREKIKETQSQLEKVKTELQQHYDQAHQRLAAERRAHQDALERLAAQQEEMLRKQDEQLKREREALLRRQQEEFERQRAELRRQEQDRQRKLEEERKRQKLLCERCESHGHETNSDACPQQAAIDRRCLRKDPCSHPQTGRYFKTISTFTCVMCRKFYSSHKEHFECGMCHVHVCFPCQKYFDFFSKNPDVISR